MLTEEYFLELSVEARDVASAVYSEAMRQLQALRHPALSPEKIRETRIILSSRILELSRHGWRDQNQLRACVLASVDAHLIHEQLRAARSDFEAKAAIYNQIADRCVALSDRDETALSPLCEIAESEMSAAKSRYMRILLLRAEMP